LKISATSANLISADQHQSIDFSVRRVAILNCIDQQTGVALSSVQWQYDGQPVADDAENMNMLANGSLVLFEPDKLEVNCI
jgi:hypothetical protein